MSPNNVLVVISLRRLLLFFVHHSHHLFNSATSTTCSSHVVYQISITHTPTPAPEPSPGFCLVGCLFGVKLNFKQFHITNKQNSNSGFKNWVNSTSFHQVERDTTYTFLELRGWYNRLASTYSVNFPRLCIVTMQNECISGGSTELSRCN